MSGLILHSVYVTIAEFRPQGQQYIGSTVDQQTRRNIFSQLMHRRMGNPPLMPGTRHYPENLSYPRQIQHSSRPSLEIRQTSQYRMVSGSNGGKLHLSNAQFSQCGFVCDLIQSQTPIVCISSFGLSSLGNRRIINELEQSTCICISINNSSPLLGVEISSVLTKICQFWCRIVLIAPVWPQRPWFSEVLQLLVLAPIWLPYFPNILTQAKGKFQHQNLPTLSLHAWELSNNQLEIKGFCKTLQILSLNQEEHLLRKSMMQNGSYTNWCHRKKVYPVSDPPMVIADFLMYLFLRKNVK